MTRDTWIYLVLVTTQLAGTLTFIVIYRRSDWRSTPIGRHLMFFSAAAGAVDLSWALLVIAKWSWLIYVLFAAQATFALLIWQRVRLVWQAQKDDAR